MGGIYRLTSLSILQQGNDIKLGRFSMNWITRQLMKTLLLAILMAVPYKGMAQNVTYTTIDFPGAINTGLGGINDSGQISGNIYDCTSGCVNFHGILITGGSNFESFDFPGATNTHGYKINNLGEIVGYILLGGVVHGHVRRSGGNFEQIDFPGSTGSVALGINDSGQIVGGYNTADGLFHGFLRDPQGNFTTIDYPGATYTSANSINNQGDIVGEYSTGGASHGFLRDSGGNFVTLDFPGASYTSARGINDFGQVAGTHFKDGTQHGFLMTSGGNFEQFDVPVPGSVYTTVQGINNQGSIVGSYGLSGDHGFLREQNTPPVAKCKDVTVSAGANCTAYTSIDDGSFDPDPGDTITLSQSPPGPYPLGSTLVTLTVTDNHGASSQCTGTVTVVDTTPPTITCPSNITTPEDPPGSGGAVVNYSPPTVSDNCSGVGAPSCNPPSGSFFPIGPTTVNCSVTGAASIANTCNFTVTVTAQGQQLTTVGPAGVWIGLKNSDAVGTKFDLLAEVFKNNVVIGSGQLDNVPGGSSGFNNAVLRTINMALSSGAVSFSQGDTLNFKLSVRIAVGVQGHRSGTARLWFNDAAANSRFSVVIGGVSTDYFLRDGFVLGTSHGPGPKKTIDVFVDRAVGGNPFKPFGTWNVTF